MPKTSHHKRMRPTRKINQHFKLDGWPDYLEPDRFIVAFRRVWQKIPLTGRRKICSYRRKHGGGVWLSRRPRPARRSMRHRNSPKAYKVLDVCLLLPNVALDFTIAHELAHLYQYAIHDSGGDYPDEKEADEIVTDWIGLENDKDYWRTEGIVLLRHLLQMFGGVRVNTMAEMQLVVSPDHGHR